MSHNIATSFGHLSVTDFSCIERADLDLMPITVIVGPQASGKSVLSKLAYFFIGLLSDQFIAINEGLTFSEFTERTRKRFISHFPASAWGGKNFQIVYSADPYSVKITRTKNRSGEPSNKVRITFSSYFQDVYLAAFKANASLAKADDAAKATRRLHLQWEVRREFEMQLAQSLGGRFFESQLFIPAGRSFFTNAGKLVAILEEGNLIDPLVSQFGRIFASIRDRHFLYVDEGKSNVFDDDLAKVLLGGKIVFGRDKEYLEANDGRRIPFNSMSSGQQELVPLFAILKRWVSLRKDAGNQLVYVEEPEAHLFPASQSRIVEAFVRAQNLVGSRLSYVFTTHSPYVLSKLSNLMKAGAVASRGPAAAEAIARIVRKSHWINPLTVGAYAIQDGELISIVDLEESAIAGDYIDEISGAMAREYSAIVDIEAKYAS